MSAWWPREAVKKMIVRSSAGSKTGVMIVMSGRCDPPASGELRERGQSVSCARPGPHFVMKTSPGWMLPLWSFIWYRTAKDMLPRWIGMNGAFATRSPSGANSAHEKSSRSCVGWYGQRVVAAGNGAAERALMLVEMAVCCKVRPMASATDMNRFAKSVSRIGSAELSRASWVGAMARGDGQRKRSGERSGLRPRLFLLNPNAHVAVPYWPVQ